MSDAPRSELHYLGATEAIELFRRRELSPVELLDAVLARTAAVEPTVNALTEQLVDEAYLGRARLGGPLREGRRLGAPPRGRPDSAQGGAAHRRAHPRGGVAAREGRRRRRHPPGGRRGSSGPARSCTAVRRPRSSPACPSPTAPCGASRGTRGTPTCRRVGRRAARAPRSPRGRRSSPLVQTSAARSGSPPRCAVSSGSRRRSGGCLGCRPSTPTPTAPTARWAAAWPTSRACRTSSPVRTRRTRRRCVRRTSCRTTSTRCAVSASRCRSPSVTTSWTRRSRPTPAPQPPPSRQRERSWRRSSSPGRVSSSASLLGPTSGRSSGRPWESSRVTRPTC